MPIDYSRIPTSDLQALRNNDLRNVSTKTLEYLSIYNRKESNPIQNPQTDQKIMGTEAPTPDWAGKHPNLYGLYGATKELYRTVGKPAIETLGMVGGGIVGAGSGFLGGMGWGAIPGAAAGSALGYTGARQATEGIDRFFDLDRASRNPSLGQRAKSIATDLSLGAVGASPTPKGQIREIAPVIDDTLLRRFGGSLSPAELSNKKTLAQVESLLEQVPFASDVMQNWREVNQLKPLVAMRNKYLEKGMENTPQGEALGQQIKAAIDKRISQFDVEKTSTLNDLRNVALQKLGSNESYETLSKEAQEILSQKSIEAMAKKNQLYGAIDEAMPQGELPFSNYNAEAQRNMEELKQLPNADGELMNVLRWATKAEADPQKEQIYKNIMEYTADPNLQKQMLKQAGLEDYSPEFKKTWSTMQSHRGQLNDIISGANKPNQNPMLHGQLTDEQRRAKLLRDALDKDFAEIAESSGGEVMDRWKVANAFYSDEYAPVWKNKIIKNMASKNPAELIDVAIKPNSTTEVMLTKQALGEQGFNNTIKPAFTNKLLNAGREGEVFNPTQFAKALFKYGDDTLLQVYSKDELSTLKQIAKFGELVLEKQLPNVGILKNIAKGSEGRIVLNSILSSVDRDPSSRELLKNISAINELLSPQQKEGLKLELLSKVFKLNRETQFVEPVSLSKNIYRYSDVLKKYLNKEEMEGLNSVSVLSGAMNRAHAMAANPSGTAKNVIAFGASNEIIFRPFETLLQGKVLDAAGQLGIAVTSKVLGARKLAELYVNPKTRTLLMKGMVTPRNTKQGRDIAKKLTIILGNEYMDEQSDVGADYEQ